MKTSYELAMERLSKAAPATKLTAQQKKQLAELDANYRAKIAAREIALKDQMSRIEDGDLEKRAELEQQLVRERKTLQNELEEKKEALRRASA